MFIVVGFETSEKNGQKPAQGLGKWSFIYYCNTYKLRYRIVNRIRPCTYIKLPFND